ncbi:MAG TPA: S9 family peptidase [Candidatus Aminicenantes bacterium]|nr:S9 family peptidase [Candidatus Aminicenantes bacterium]HRY65614.1 S9 family peptidase [Candidatus Aminicenantes bacterium]HRZ72498.1 S9 family peptidase [Candidatus Aminicenantes bacterium]
MKRTPLDAGKLILAGLVMVSTLGAMPGCKPGQPPLIPRAIILEESERGNPVLSPSGREIAYIAPENGVGNIWLATVGKNGDRIVTHNAKDGIDYCFWQADGEHVLYYQDQSGDENKHLFQTNIRTGITKDLTPFPGARATDLIDDPRCPDTLLIHINARDESLFDLYRLDLKTGSLKLDAENPGDVARFYADHQLRVRAAYVTKPDNSAEIRVRDGLEDPWRSLIAWGPDEMNSDSTGIAGFNAEDTKIWIITSLGANAERLLEVDLRTGERKVLSEDPQFDIARLLVNPLNSSLEAVAYEKERLTWIFLDPSVREDFEALRKLRDGEISIRGRDRTDRIWLVRFEAPDSPTTYYHFDRSAKKAVFLFSEDPKLEKLRLAKKEPIQFRARDGLTIYGYLSLPVGIRARNLPLIVQVHGGPWARDSWRLDFPVQCLANRGYAVLQVNYRASTGYGKAYQNAGNLEWGGKVIQDLVDGKNWVVSRGIADPKRAAIMGGSFGGYAALAALAFHPREFACGIAINAISDANLFMASMPPYWTTTKARFETRMGKDPEFLKAISPVHKSSQVVRPLLIMHNANDVRVKLEHAERMVKALRENGKDVTYLVFPGAGHVGGGAYADFLKRWAAIEAFLGKHLGGRVEPPGEAERWDRLLR